jgi:hypothetical protein
LRKALARVLGLLRVHIEDAVDRVSSDPVGHDLRVVRSSESFAHVSRLHTVMRTAK